MTLFVAKNFLSSTQFLNWANILKKMRKSYNKQKILSLHNEQLTETNMNQIFVV